MLRNLTVTPTFNLRNDTYIFGQNQEGLTSDRSYAAGVETAYVATPDATFLFSYMNEQRSQNVLSASNTQICPVHDGNRPIPLRNFPRRVFAIT